jgi:hypothetical protein
LTTAKTINDVAFAPGVYIDGANITTATIGSAQIADLAVDDAKIASLNVGKLTAGSINVDDYIQSTDYVEGEEGWKIHGNGFAEFGAAVIRGQLTAAQIDSRGLTIRTAAGAVILNAGTSEFSGNVTGTVDGTDASTLVTTANDAATAAGAAQGTADDAATAASTAQDAADAAQDAADAAQIDASNALTGLTTKLNSDARNVLAGEGGLAVGTLEWNSSGVRTGGYGVGFSANGLAAYNSAGAVTFALNGATGDATFAGDISAATGTFTGGLDVKSASSGARMEIKNNVIKVFDAAGVLRVQIGDLSA